MTSRVIYTVRRIPGVIHMKLECGHWLRQKNVQGTRKRRMVRTHQECAECELTARQQYVDTKE